MDPDIQDIELTEDEELELLDVPVTPVLQEEAEELDAFSLPDTRVLQSFRHEGSKLSFFGAAQQTQQSQTALTDNTGGSTNNTLDDVSTVVGSATELSEAAFRDDVNNRLSTINNNLAELAEDIDELRTVLKNYGFIA